MVVWIRNAEQLSVCLLQNEPASDSLTVSFGSSTRAAAVDEHNNWNRSSATRPNAVRCGASI